MLAASSSWPLDITSADLAPPHDGISTLNYSLVPGYGGVEQTVIADYGGVEQTVIAD